MLKLATAKDMQAIDKFAIEEMGIPGMVLMENSGSAIVSVVLSLPTTGPMLLKALLNQDMYRYCPPQGLHFVDTVHYVTGVGCPKYAVAHFTQVEWKDGFTVPDSVEMTFEYPEGWVLRYGQFFGNSGGRYLNVYGTRGTLDGSNWSWTGEWKLKGSDSDTADKIAEGTKLPPVEGTPHMKNWLECLHTRQQPLAPMEAGYSQAVAGLLADLSNKLGRRMMFDQEKREIREA